MSPEKPIPPHLVQAARHSPYPSVSWNEYGVNSHLPEAPVVEILPEFQAAIEPVPQLDARVQEAIQSPEEIPEAIPALLGLRRTITEHRIERAEREARKHRKAPGIAEDIMTGGAYASVESPHRPNTRSERLLAWRLHGLFRKRQRRIAHQKQLVNQNPYNPEVKARQKRGTIKDIKYVTSEDVPLPTHPPGRRMSRKAIRHEHKMHHHAEKPERKNKRPIVGYDRRFIRLIDRSKTKASQAERREVVLRQRLVGYDRAAASKAARKQAKREARRLSKLPPPPTTTP